MDGTPDRVLIGLVPYKTLGMRQDSTGSWVLADKGVSITDALDGYDRYLTYAVTESLTDSNAFNEAHGAISIVDENNTSILNVEGSAHLVLVAHGVNGRGAYLREGDIYRPCSGAGLDIENCNNTSTFRSALHSLAEGPNYYDDNIIFELWVGTSFLWARTDANPDHIHNLNIGNVGVATEDPQQQLQITGNILTDNMHADRLCDVDDLDCFSAQMIGGVGIDCVPGDAMTGVAFEDSVCATGPVYPPITGTCPPGEYVIGVTTIGTVLCDAPLPTECASQNVTLCGQNFTLALAPDGSTQTINDTTGGTAARTYTCNAPTWSAGSTTGTCGAPPPTECASQNVTLCGQSFTLALASDGATQTINDTTGGTAARTYTCNAPTWSAGSTTGTCGAAPPPTDCPLQNVTLCSENRMLTADIDGASQTISAGYSRQRIYTCNSGTWTAGALSGSCTPPASTCSSQSVTLCGQSFTLASASDGSTQTINDTTGGTASRTYTCNAPTWSAGSTTGTCGATCTPTSETRTTTPCPTGYTGTITEQRDYQCPSGTWTSWYETSNTCTATPTPACGSAAGVMTSSQPTGSAACSVGTFSNSSDTSAQWRWTCGGSVNCTAPKQNCTLPWSGTIASGASVTAYQYATRTCSQTCTSQTRTCDNGTLSGSYTNQSCTQSGTWEATCVLTSCMFFPDMHGTSCSACGAYIAPDCDPSTGGPGWECRCQ
jgi:hypothetical protein